VTVRKHSALASVTLLQAVERDELVLDYQPIVSTETGRIHSLEALVRWDHPRLGRLGPTRFLALADHPGLGAQLTGWVLRAAIADCVRWRAAGLAASVAVNVAPAVLGDDFVPLTVSGLLAEHGLDPHHLTIELTERHSTIDTHQLRAALTALAMTGVRLALDDFGTGASSLSRLQHLHVDELKIDQSFVLRMATDPSDQQIVRFVTQLGHALGMHIVAEGVEQGAVLSKLRDLRVDRAQGFLLGRPATWSTWLGLTATRQQAG
jgi:EAL domain-containing protein (putative c-di-GMP-specific phosphodiesterase class I)